jgi:hypothetical protein
MLYVPEGFLYLKAVVVDIHNLSPAAGKVIGQYVPGFCSPTAFRAADNPQMQSE